MLTEATFFGLVLDYGDILYIGASAAALKPLDSVQYLSALRFITGGNYRTHRCDLYDQVGWPSVSP